MKGTKNTKFFHCTSTSRKKRNRIEKLKNASSNWCLKGVGVQTLIVDYYKDLFSNQGVDDEGVCRLVGKGISEEQDEQLLSPFTAAKIKETLDSMHPNNVAEGDGMKPAFSQRFGVLQFLILLGNVSGFCRQELCQLI